MAVRTKQFTVFKSLGKTTKGKGRILRFGQAEVSGAGSKLKTGVSLKIEKENPGSKLQSSCNR